MSLLSDYQKHVEKPRMEADALEIKALRQQRDNLHETLSEVRQFIVIACGDQAPYVKAALARIDASLQPSQ